MEDFVMGHPSSPSSGSGSASSGQARLRGLQRRTFFKAIGLGLAAPFAARIARLAGAAPGPRPTRLLFFYIPHGSPVEHFDPKGADGSFALNMTGESVLSPLEPFKQYVNVMRGISHVGISNHATIRSALTLGESNPISIDQAIAKALGTKALVLGTIPYQNPIGSRRGGAAFPGGAAAMRTLGKRRKNWRHRSDAGKKKPRPQGRFWGGIGIGAQ
jgi:hypothetical protein